MLRKWVLLPAGLLAAAMIVRSASGRPEEPFGVLRGTPSAPPPAGSSALPPGVVPARGAAMSGPDRAPRPHNPFPLTAAAGDWLICAAHYGGPDGFHLAHQVAVILRDQHRMPVYILDRGEDERRKQDAEWEALKRQYPDAQIRRRMVRIEDNFAVLVGGYKDLAAASAALPKFRALPMPPLKLDGGRSPYEQLFFTEAAPDKKGMVVKTASINPFTQALAVRNPMVPPSAKQKWDPFWKTLNSDEEYSLLKNPKKYTLIVKEYLGSAQVVSGSQPARATGLLGGLGIGGAREGANAPGDALAASQAQAHELARFLRTPQFGFETYVLHMRTGSVVAVGGFDGPDDPAISGILRRLNSLKNSIKANGTTGGGDPIGLKAVPQMAEVPRL